MGTRRQDVDDFSNNSLTRSRCFRSAPESLKEFKASSSFYFIVPCQVT